MFNMFICTIIFLYTHIYRQVIGGRHEKFVVLCKMGSCSICLYVPSYPCIHIYTDKWSEGGTRNLLCDTRWDHVQYGYMYHHILVYILYIQTSGTTNTSLISLTLSYMLSCCGDRSVRKCVASRASVWNSCLTFIVCLYHFKTHPK